MFLLFSLFSLLLFIYYFYYIRAQSSFALQKKNSATFKLIVTISFRRTHDEY